MSVLMYFGQNEFLETISETILVKEFKERICRKFALEFSEILLKLDQIYINDSRLLQDYLISNFILTNNISTINVQINDLTFAMKIESYRETEWHTMTVSSTLSVSELKQIISKKLNFNLNNWILKTNCKTFSEKDLLKNCIETKKIHIIENKEFEVFIINDKRCYKIPSKRNTTIAEFKLAVSEKIGVLHNTFFLSFNGERLEVSRSNPNQCRKRKNLLKYLLNCKDPVEVKSEPPSEENFTLESFQIKNNSIVHVILKTRGGQISH